MNIDSACRGECDLATCAFTFSNSSAQREGLLSEASPDEVCTNVLKVFITVNHAV